MVEHRFSTRRAVAHRQPPSLARSCRPSLTASPDAMLCRELPDAVLRRDPPTHAADDHKTLTAKCRPSQGIDIRRHQPTATAFPRREPAGTAIGRRLGPLGCGHCCGHHRPLPAACRHRYPSWALLWAPPRSCGHWIPCCSLWALPLNIV